MDLQGIHLSSMDFGVREYYDGWPREVRSEQDSFLFVKYFLTLYCLISTFGRNTVEIPSTGTKFNMGRKTGGQKMKKNGFRQYYKITVYGIEVRSARENIVCGMQNVIFLILE